MRVALVATSLRLAGAEKQFVYVARTLLAAGVQTKVFYLGAGDHYHRVLQEAGIPLCQIFHKGRPLLMLFRLLQQSRRFKPHIMMASQFGDLVFAGPAGRLCGALVLGGVRSDGLYELRSSGRRGRFLLALAHGLIANSFHAKENLAQTGINQHKFAILPNVIDLTDFDRRAAEPFHYDVPAGRVLAVAVGSLHECKRFDRFLEALALARARKPAIFGLIAGKDLGAKSALEQKAQELGLLHTDIAFFGECEQVPALLRRSRFLVLCSDYEGFPNVILEAMAAGLPVLTTPAGDAPRIVQDGVTGYVLNADDAQELADCMCRLAANPQLSAQLGEAGRARVSHEYNLSSLSERLLLILREFACRERKKSVLRALEKRQDTSGSPITATLSPA